ncbi:post-GPI attachment to proteins factor 4 [Spea bombifrons]|uniref:post-GPI attachment to proteins factor 4 n=1 Tax=Spea bombifrons TaxID=233779 RepID=UPI00234AAD37|nr:post-GPI attachment to proteins factor 4 [Spea bombifrons]XP_053306557.1 post-GPI attachment to proteins factor 4 [Spea bombifrons]XP_053306558.1 post-GPI attachment to proteins factor 4 [Spea bombifrons]XP_053306559.1 post-GPI attachment to proteins factor 4 [Spea bombifrons]
MRPSVLVNSPVCHLLLMFSLTLFLAPFCFDSLLYSPLFSRSLHLRRLSREFLLQNLQAGADALMYFQQRIFPGLENSNDAYNVSIPCTYKESKSLLSSPSPESIQLVITIITTRRRPEYHYLLQVARGFLDRLSECGNDCSRFQIFICNVDPSPSYHTDACLLSKILPSVEHYLHDEQEDSFPNRFEREKQDYAFCLSRTLDAFTPDYVLLVEDDAVPHTDIFRAFFQLVQVRFTNAPLGGGLYAKFYHPERLQGYLNPEPMRILEWFGVGILSGFLINWIYCNLFHKQRFSWHLFLAFSAYSMLLAELIGRHYLLELRRISPAFYNVVPATECCTPAMLFSETSVRRTLAYLEEITCEAGYAKDTALYKELSKRGEWAWAIEPNMVTHIGLFSTLRGASEGEEPLLL